MGPLFQRSSKGFSDIISLVLMIILWHTWHQQVKWFSHNPLVAVRTMTQVAGPLIASCNFRIEALMEKGDSTISVGTVWDICWRARGGWGLGGVGWRWKRLFSLPLFQPRAVDNIWTDYNLSMGDSSSGRIWQWIRDIYGCQCALWGDIGSLGSLQASVGTVLQ